MKANRSRGCAASPSSLRARTAPGYALAFLWLAAGLHAGAGHAAQAHEKSGKQVVDSVCVQCHGTGINGAPKIGDAKAWAKLSDQGLTALTSHALEGVRNMPPHGGNFKLTDIEIQRGITYMVNQSGGHWT